MIDLETALGVSSRPHDFKLLVSAAGQLSTSMEHLDDVTPDADASNGRRATPPPHRPFEPPPMAARFSSPPPSR